MGAVPPFFSDAHSGSDRCICTLASCGTECAVRRRTCTKGESCFNGTKLFPTSDMYTPKPQVIPSCWKKIHSPLRGEMEGNARKRKRREAGPGGGSSSSTDEGNTDVKISMPAQSAAALSAAESLLGIAAAPARTPSRGNSPEQSRNGRPGNHAVAAAPDPVLDDVRHHERARPVQARRLNREAGEEEEPDAETLHSPSPTQPAAASPTRSDSGSTQSESEEHNPARRLPSLTALTGTSSQLEQVAEQLQDPTQQRGQGRAELQQQQLRDQQVCARSPRVRPHGTPPFRKVIRVCGGWG